MGLHFGSKQVKELYFGDKKVAKVYYGSKLVWPTSYTPDPEPEPDPEPVMISLTFSPETDLTEMVGNDIDNDTPFFSVGFDGVNKTYTWGDVKEGLTIQCKQNTVLTISNGQNFRGSNLYYFIGGSDEEKQEEVEISLETDTYIHIEHDHEKIFVGTVKLNEDTNLRDISTTVSGYGVKAHIYMYPPVEITNLTYFAIMGYVEAEIYYQYDYYGEETETKEGNTYLSCANYMEPSYDFTHRKGDKQMLYYTGEEELDIGIDNELSYSTISSVDIDLKAIRLRTYDVTVNFNCD